MPSETGLPDPSGSGSGWVGDSERLASLADLRERYAEARAHVPVGEHHANLDWILGERRNAARDPLALRAGTVRLIALWLQDLASALDRASERGSAEQKTVVAPAESLAGTLREATRRFLSAFRRPE